MFHQPMSSPHKTSMLGFFDSTISSSLKLTFQTRIGGAADAFPCLLSAWALNEMQQHREEGEYPDQHKNDRRRVDRGMHALLRQARDRRETSAVQVTTRPAILPERNDKHEDTAEDQPKPHEPRSVRHKDSRRRRQLVKAIEELDDREAESDQRYGRANPREHRALE